MDQDGLLASLTSLNIPKNHASVGLSNLIASNRQVRSLFANRRLPDKGWSDIQIQLFLLTLSTLDTSNSEDRWCGVGEREGRVYSSLVSQRNFGLSHGVGRSGDITEAQPKAAGSSTLARLTLHLVLDAIRRGAGLSASTAAAHGIVLPLCTGMSMSLVLSSLRSFDSNKDKYIVLWSRIDQKSCFKAIQSAGFTCVVIPTKIDNDEVVTDLDAMEAAIVKHGEANILAIITTTSCFAPRVPDKVDHVAVLCDQKNIAHIINNAYGLQCEITCKLINRACVKGRVDAIVCSTDKNFLVPVGGAIVISPKEDVIANVGKVYPGRASSAPIVDLFITLLSMGLSGYKELLSERKRLRQETMIQGLTKVAEKYGERVLSCPNNSISFGITVDGLGRPRTEGEDLVDHHKRIATEISYFGSMLFTRCVSGTRVVPRAQSKTLGFTHAFRGFGSSTDEYPYAYLTAACAIGVTEIEMNEFFVRLDKTFKDFIAKRKKDDVKKAMADLKL